MREISVLRRHYEDTAARMEIFPETDYVQAVFPSASDRPSISKYWASSYNTSVPE
jgi:hypothetical protein